MTSPDARTNHYGTFYGLDPLPRNVPIAVVYGNCQAESVRILLAGTGLCGIRIPPVHELTASDLPHLRRLLKHTDVLIAQPVSTDYRGLRLGTNQIIDHLPPSARLCLIPVVRYAGLYPYQAIVRAPSDRSLTPPIVPYHDLRVVSEAAGQLKHAEIPALSAEQVRLISENSLAELRRRETLHKTVMVSDVFSEPSFGHMRTINHPGNLVLSALAVRVLNEVGVSGTVGDPGRELLNETHAPRENAVIAAFGLADAAQLDWRVGTSRIASETIRAAHLNWYRNHPDAVVAGLERHATSLRILGLM